ncbi:hypothetical protein BJ170DRAFT_640221 [Xylariales sp. AK1849]|nr:hypothetical protein BJ170DRAFT_640221 [Xylariales sp. AK1849]
MESKAAESTDIKAKVLQSTLDEVATRNEQGTHDQIECCVICLENIAEACEAQPCQHTNFDFLCLVSWLQHQSKCPLCKAEVREVRYESEPSDKQWKTFVVPEKREIRSSSTAPRRPLPPRRNWPYYRPHRRRVHDTPSQLVGDDEELTHRRQIYRDQLYSLHVGSNRVSQYKDLTPQLFESDAALISRARMWLRRELKVFEFLHTPSEPLGSEDAMTRRRANNAEFLLEYIVAILKTVDIQGSRGQAEDMLQEFLGRDNTRLLLHELKSFLRSPYTSLKDWDRYVQYDKGKKRRVEGEDNGDNEQQGQETQSLPSLRHYGGDSVGRMRRDSYRPQYSDDDHQRIGSARRHEPS